MGIPNFPKLRLLQLWRPITLSTNLWLRWGPKQSCSPCRKLFNSMSHVTCTQGNWGNFRLLMVGNEIVKLTSDPSFGHNLCFYHPNESCEPILSVYVPRNFQWDKELLNPMGFFPYNCSMKIRESIGTPTPKVGVHLGVWRFKYLLTFMPTIVVDSLGILWPSSTCKFMEATTFIFLMSITLLQIYPHLVKPYPIFLCLGFL